MRNRLRRQPPQKITTQVALIEMLCTATLQAACVPLLFRCVRILHYFSPNSHKKRLCHTSDTTSILSVQFHPTITTREGRGPGVRPRWHESRAHVSASQQYDSADCWPYQPWIFPRADRLVSYSSASWWSIDGRFYKLACDGFLPIVPDISVLQEGA